jgi:hypothetical protein
VKISTFVTVCVMFVVACLLCLPMYAQDVYSSDTVCTTGTCYRQTAPARTVIYNTAEVVGTVVTAPVRFLQEVQPVRSVVESFASGLAQSKAERQAAMQQCCHVGGGFGGSRAEGVGFSTSSPEDAVRRCCYYGQRPIREQGVAYGYNRRYRVYGWYATIICD